MGKTSFPGGIEVGGVDMSAGNMIFTGKRIFCDPVNGKDGNLGDTLENAVKTLTRAYALATSGNNDVIILVGNGTGTSSSGAATLTAAFTWAKNATHLVGFSRARISTSIATGIVVTGQGCYFSNFWVHTSNNTAGSVLWTDQGQRNLYEDIVFQGWTAGTTANDGATSRCLIVGAAGTGKGEHIFRRCVIGQDTIARGAANCSLELLGGTPRNQFIDCVFPFYGGATALGIKVAAAAGIDRWNLFRNCEFINGVKSSGTTMTALCTMAASAGGLLYFKNCSLVGITDWFSDATTAGQMYVDGAPPTAATSGLAVNPA